MAYIAPIHRPSSIRHALKLNFLSVEEDTLVVAKSNRLELYTQTPDGLALQHSFSIYGQATILQKLRPAASPTDHLFVGTDRYMYFTLSWDAARKQVKTEKVWESVADRASRESQTGERCHVDPSGRFMTLEVYEGIITVIPLVQHVQPGRKRKLGAETAHMEPQPSRVPEMFVRSSAFLYPRPGHDKPRLALLYEDSNAKVKLVLRAIAWDSQGGEIKVDEEGELVKGDREMGAAHLIPVEGPSHGLIILGETSIGYYNDDTGEVRTDPLEDSTIFVAWERIDKQRFLFADDYGRLYLFMLVLDDNERVISWKLDSIAKTSRANVLVYLDSGYVFVGSHQGDSQLVRISERPVEVVQTFSNIAPILDFTIMDMGNRSGEGQTNEYSSGQARLVTGSGAFQDGSLRSVRSGVGLEDLGVLGEMDHISNLFDLKSSASTDKADTLLVTFVDESRVFRFDPSGEVEEVDAFAGLSLSETTLAAANVPQGRVVQVTNSRVQVTDLDGGMVVSEWLPSGGQSITDASVNDTHVLVSLGGVFVVALSIDSGLNAVSQKKFGADSQVACVALPSAPTASNICFLGFWQNSALSVCAMDTLKPYNTVQISEESIPRSLLLTQIFPDHPPTLFAAMADGNVVTYTYNTKTHQLSGRKSIILGTQQATFRALPRGNGLFNVFATCEHPSLIYGSEGRLVYSAVTAENATTVCPFDTPAYPGSVAIATKEDLRIALVDTERTTHVQTLKVDETVRRTAYSPSLKAFGLGTIKRILKGGEEILLSHFKLVDEIAFKELDTFRLKENELVEAVIRCELADGSGGTAERFVIGTAYMDDANAVAERGRIVVLEVSADRVLKVVTELAVKGGVRCLGIMTSPDASPDKETASTPTPPHPKTHIVAALVKTIVIYDLTFRSASTPSLTKLASYRCSTAPIDLAISGTTIIVADLMKSAVVVQFAKGAQGMPDSIVEVARHYRTAWATAIAQVDAGTWLEADAEGNLVVLARNEMGVTEEDRRRLGVRSELCLGEMVNRIREVDGGAGSGAEGKVVVPRAFLGTTEGSIYLFCLIAPAYQNLLITLQANLADLLDSPGGVSFDTYRAFKNQVHEASEPNRFVDGEFIERFLDVEESVQMKAVRGLDVDVEGMRTILEGLRRLH